MDKPSTYKAIAALFIRAIIWTPVGVVISVVSIGSAVGVAAFPLIGLVFLWTGDFVSGGLYVAGGGISFLVARVVRRYFWETPPSVL